MIIQTPTPDLVKSLEFFEALGFTVINHEDKIYLLDGNSKIRINPERHSRLGLVLFGVPESQRPANRTKLGDSEVSISPSGTWIYFENGVEPKFDSYKGEPSILGNNAGPGLESPDLEESILFWTKLGFEVNGGAKEHGYVSLGSEQQGGLAIMKAGACPHMFYNPSLSYFNGKENLKVIESIRGTGIEILEEVTAFNEEGIVDNIILREQGGLGFFIFSD